MTVTGWTIEYIEETPFRDVIKLFEYWEQWPPVHMLVRGAVGYEPQGYIADPVAFAEAARIVGAGRTTKLKDAPERERLIFEKMREQAKKEKRGG